MHPILGRRDLKNRRSFGHPVARQPAGYSNTYPKFKYISTIFHINILTWSLYFSKYLIGGFATLIYIDHIAPIVASILFQLTFLLLDS